MSNDTNNGFQYAYSAKEQDELKRIREKYTLNKEEDKMERLRRLDRGVTQRAQAVSLVFGIIGALLLGFGMSLIMSELGDMLISSKWLSILLGVLAGITGGALASLAYPVYNYITKRERERVAPEILRLTDELMK